MKEYISKNKLVISILAISLFLGIFVRVWNLSDAMFLNPDEYRTLRLELRSPFLYAAYKIPALLWGRYPGVASYTTAFWGVLSILMVFVIGKLLFNDKVGCYSALILSLFAFHVSFSRSGWAAIFHSLLLLLAFWSFSLYHLKQDEPRNTYIIASGILLGLAILTYVPPYAAIAVFFILSPVILKSKGLPLKRISVVMAVLGCSILVVLVSADILLRINTGSFLGNLIRYSWRGSLQLEANPSVPLRLISRISADGGIFQLGLIIIGIIYAVIDWFLKRDKQLFLLVGFICLSYLIFTAAGLLKLHDIYIRHYVYLIPFLCISSAYLLYKLELATNKYLVITLLIIFSLFSLPKSTKIIRNTFKMKPITEWLKANKISKDKIATASWVSTPFYFQERGDTLKAITMPGGHIDYYTPSCRFEIDWKKISELYHQGQIRYILTSGIGGDSTIGYNDQVLKRFQPLKTWTHPYRLRYPENKQVQDFALYELKDIIPALEE